MTFSAVYDVCLIYLVLVPFETEFCVSEYSSVPCCPLFLSCIFKTPTRFTSKVFATFSSVSLENYNHRLHLLPRCVVPSTRH